MRYSMMTVIALSFCSFSANALDIHPTLNSKQLSDMETRKDALQKLDIEFKNALKLDDKEAKHFDKEIKKILHSLQDNEVVDLLITLPRYEENVALYEELQMNHGYFQTDGSGTDVYFLNGKDVTEKEVKEFIKSRDKALEAYLQKQRDLRQVAVEKIHTYLRANGIQSSFDPQKNNFSYFTLNMTKKEIQKFIIANEEYVGAIGLNAKHSLSVEDAIIATRVNPVVTDWTPQRNNQIGEGIGIYYSDAFCPDDDQVEGLYHEFERDFWGTYDSQAGHTFLVTGVLANAAPGAFKYCKNGNFDENYPGVLPNSSEIFNNIGPRIRVESYSINRNYADDNTYTAEDALWDNHVNDTGNIVFNAAGNHNSDEPTMVESPGKAFNIVTLGNYDDDTDIIYVTQGLSNRSNYSNPDLGNEKPELTAPGRSISYSMSTFNNGVPEIRTGTSFATPHAAGIAADFMSENPFLQGNTAVIKAMMLASATDEITDIVNEVDGSDNAVGAGGINVETGIYKDRAAAYWYDSSGAGPFDLSSSISCFSGWGFSAYDWQSRARVAFTWMIDGDYALSNPDKGSVMYFYVTNHDGNVVANSFNGSTEFPNSNNWLDDNWAVAEFDPKHIYSDYTLHICRYNTFSFDENAELNMAFAATAR